MNELLILLQGYLTSGKSLVECSEWLAGVDWDDPELNAAEREILGTLELLITEKSEGMREESDFHEDTTRFVADQAGMVLAKVP